MAKISKDNPIFVLSVGTRILLKDVMDQYLRSLGEVKTFYASKLSVAQETFNDKKPQIIFCEHAFEDGSVLEFIEAIGGLDAYGDRYFVLATEGASDELVSLAMEKVVDEILVKPFSIDTIHQIVDRYLEKRANSSQEWVRDMRRAKQSYQEKRFQEAEELFSQASRKYGNNPTVQVECADFFLRRNMPQLSLPLLEDQIKRTPDNVRVLHLLGLSYRKLGRLREGAERLLAACAFSPLNSLRRADLADTYGALAEEQLVLALKTESENSSLILGRARYQFVRKDYLALVTYLDAKRAFLSEAGRKEADAIVAAAKKLGGIR